MKNREESDISVPQVVRLPFHNGAQVRLVQVSTDYSRKVGGFAEQLAVSENAAEVQPGHVDRAKLAIEEIWHQKSERLAAVKTLAQIVGSGLLSVGASGIAFNSAQAVSDALIWIGIGALGLIGVVVGVMIRG